MPNLVGSGQKGKEEAIKASQWSSPQTEALCAGSRFYFQVCRFDTSVVLVFT